MKKPIANRPICPECGCNTLVLFTPPKQPIKHELLGTNEYIDWDRAHLYCCNGETNCKKNYFLTNKEDLITPVPGKKINYFKP